MNLSLTTHLKRTRLFSRSRIESLAVILFFLVATILLTRPLADRVATSVYSYGDPLLQAWTLGWNVHQLFLDPLHLYNAPNFYPNPNTLAYSNSLLPQTALALPIILLTNNLPLANNLNVLFTFVLNGYGVYLLLRAWKANLWGALVGGMAFAFGYYHLNQLSHLDLLSTEWMPFVLLALHKVFQRGLIQHYVLLGLVFLLSALSAFYYAFFTAALVGIYLLYELILARGHWPRRMWVGLFFTFALVLALLIPFSWPYIQLNRDFGLARLTNEVIRFSAVPATYLASLTRFPLFSWSQTFFAVPQGEEVLSPGFFAIPLALFALLLRSSWPRSSFLLVMILVSFVCSLGIQMHWGTSTIPLPYALVFNYVPGMTAMRAVSRWGVLVLLGTALLAGLGFAGLVERLGKRGLLSAGLGCAMLIALYAEYDTTPVRMMIGTLLWQPTAPVYTWLKQQPPGAAIELPLVDPNDGANMDVWYQYYTLVHGHPIVNGASGFQPPTYDEIIRRVKYFPSAEALALLHALDVRYVIVHTSQMADWSRDQPHLALFKQSLRLAGQFGSDSVFEVLPQANSTSVELRAVAPSEAQPGTRVHGALVALLRGPEDQILSLRGLLDIHIRWLDSNGQIRQEESKRVSTPLVVDQAGTVTQFDFQTPVAVGSYHVEFDIQGTPESHAFTQTIEIRPPPQESGPAVQLASYSWSPRATRSSETLNVMLYWRVRTVPLADYTVFVHLVDSNGNTRAEVNAAPLGGELPTHQWQPGEIIVEQYTVNVPPGVPQGRYSLVAGMFDARTNQLIPILGPDGEAEQAVAIDGDAWIAAGRNASPPNPMHSTQVEFGNWATLGGYDSPVTGQAGESIPLVFYWQARARTAENYTLFVHLIGPDGRSVAQADAPPRSGNYPTSAWNDGEWIRDRHTLTLPSDLAPGSYTLQIGWYRPDTGVRVPMTNDRAESDAVTLDKINVK